MKQHNENMERERKMENLHKWKISGEVRDFLYFSELKSYGILRLVFSDVWVNYDTFTNLLFQETSVFFFKEGFEDRNIW